MAKQPSNKSAKRAPAKGSAGSRSASARRAAKGKAGATQRGAKRAKPGGGRGTAAQERRRRDLKGAAANLPRWVVDGLARVTPAPRVGPALEALGEASEALSDGRFQAAVRKGERAKQLAPRDPTVRETLGLAAYRMGNWQLALRELRSFRRMTGEPTHLPVEMDVLRALDRPDDIRRTWAELQRSNPRPAVLKEGKVVYASHLMDVGRTAEAYDLVRPRSLRSDPFPEDLRLWYVAAKAAARLGKLDQATTLRNAIFEHDPGFPGMDELERAIAR